MEVIKLLNFDIVDVNLEILNNQIDLIDEENISIYGDDNILKIHHKNKFSDNVVISTLPCKSSVSQFDINQKLKEISKSSSHLTFEDFVNELKSTIWPEN